jgi:predicted transposase/invertase (TIGR01784 family)
MWEKDMAEERPLRLIIPLVFYHGKEKWNIPQSFADQFHVSDEIKKFLLNYRYILFDTKDWDFGKEKNKELGKNVFLLSALALMKSISNDDLDSIVELFRFWHEKGFTNKDKVLFFLTYISETKDIEPKELQEILEEVRIEGGDIMPTLAQRWKNEGRQQGWTEGRTKGRTEGKTEGRVEEKFETARRMLNDDFPIKSIVKYTGLTEKQVRSLLN